MSETQPAASQPQSRPAVRRFSHRAMATVFEVLVAGPDEQAARGAAEAAFTEIDRMERLLSHFKPYSDISRINAAPPGKAVVVEVEVIECLDAALAMWRRTGGAFDVTAGSEAAAGSRSGMKRLDIDSDTMTVKRLDAGVQVDLGGIGKGYALDRAAQVLGEWGVRDALMHGGTSTLLAMGRRPGLEGWVGRLGNPSDGRADALGEVTLKDRAFSGSSTAHSRHIIDPRTGKAVEADHAAWAITDDAADADALTTALCVMSDAEIRKFATDNPKVAFIIGRHVEGTWRLEEYGPKALREKAGNR